MNGSSRSKLHGLKNVTKIALMVSLLMPLALSGHAYADELATSETSVQAETKDTADSAREAVGNYSPEEDLLDEGIDTGDIDSEEDDDEIPEEKEVVQKTSYDVAEFAKFHTNDLPDGSYNFISNKRSDGVFDAKGGATSNGTVVQLYASNSSDAQVWRVTHDEDGLITIINAKSGLALDCTGGSSSSGTKLQLYKPNGSKAQKWIAVLDGDSLMLISALSKTIEVDDLGFVAQAKVIDLSSGSTSNGTRLQLWTSNNTDAQRFTVQAALTIRERLDELAAQYSSEVADGTYAVVSAAGSRSVLDVSGGSRADGGNAQAWRSNASKAQRWAVSHDDAGYLTLVNAGSGKALDVSGGRATSGANVQQWAPNGTRAQKWVAVPSASGGYELVSALDPSLALDLSGGSAADGTNAQLWSRNGTRAQRWTLAPASAEVAPCDRLESLEGGWLELSPACAEGKALDVSAGSAADGANVQVWSSNGSLAQAWQLEWADGWYRLYNAASGKCLDVASGDCVPGANAQQWSGGGSNPNQLFSVTGNGDGTYSLTSKATGLALDVSGASSSDGANVDLWSPNGTSAQRWALAAVSPAPSEGAYAVSTSLSSSVALDVSGASRSSGANVQSYASNGTWAQRWYLGSNGDGTWFLECMGSAMRLAADASGNVCQRAADASDASQRWAVSAARGGWVLESAAWPGRVLDLSGASTASGANVQVYAANGTAAQRWRLSSASDQPSGGTYYVCAAADPSKVLDVSGGSSSDGANVQLYANNGTGAQKWVLSRQPDGTYLVSNAQSGKALDVANGSASAGANVRQWSSNGTGAQRWRVSYRPGGLRLESALGGSLALSAAGTSSGSNVELGAAGGKNQGFLLTATTYLPPAQQQMAWKAQNYYSATSWLALVDTTQNKVAIFSGSRGNWTMQKYWDCTSGALNTPTITGEFTVGSRGYSFGENHGYSCYYWTQIHGAYLFHSIKYYANTRNVMDGRLGVNASAGCVRLQIDNAEWIYRNIPYNTKVVIYR